MEAHRDEAHRGGRSDVRLVVVDEDGRRWLDLVAVDERLEDPDIRLRRADLAGDDDSVEPAQERVALERDRERLGRPVAERVQPDMRDFTNEAFVLL